MGTPRPPRDWLENVLRRSEGEIASLCTRFIDNPGTLLQKLPPMRQRVIEALGALGASVETKEEILAERERQVRSALAEAPGKAPADERTDRFVHTVATIYALAENYRDVPPAEPSE